MAEWKGCERIFEDLPPTIPPPQIPSAQLPELPANTPPGDTSEFDKDDHSNAVTFTGMDKLPSFQGNILLLTQVMLQVWNQSIPPVQTSSAPAFFTPEMRKRDTFNSYTATRFHTFLHQCKLFFSFMPPCWETKFARWFTPPFISLTRGLNGSNLP